MLQILDTNAFIKEHKCLEVKNPQSFDRKFEPTEDGLYSRIIFGINKQELFTKFGYINLGARILHPLMYKNIVHISGIFKKVLTKTTKVIIQNGILVESETGWTGIKDLYTNWDGIDFKKYDEKNSKVKSLIEFIISKKKDELFEDKVLVIPVNFRPAMPKNGLMVEDEISGFYKSLLNMNDTERLGSEYMQSLMQLTDKYSIIQTKVNELYDYFIAFLEKKNGLFRTSLIGKRQNNTARLVANAQPTVPMNCIVLPWHACLNIFDLPIIGMINQDPFEKKYLTQLNMEDLSTDDIANLFGFIYHNVDIYSKNNSAQVKIWQDLLLDTFNFHSELRCFTKRDPAWDKGSYHLLQPVINTDNEFACIINSALYNPLGGDSFYTNYTMVDSGSGIIDSNESGELYLPAKKTTNIIKSMHKIYASI
jgi:hypothetical protein